MYRSSSEWDLRDVLHDIRQPTLILHGAADAIVRVEEAQQLASALPDAHLLIVPEAGHVPTLTRPQVIADAIDHFFAPQS